MTVQAVGPTTGTVTSTESPAKRVKTLDASHPSKHQDAGRIYEYTSACDPDMPAIPCLALPASCHKTGPTRVIPFDLSAHLGTGYPATSPNLLASYLRVCEGESLAVEATATSQAFYAIRGTGCAESEHGTIHFGQGDLFVLPATKGPVTVSAERDTAVYHVSDAPLLQYLGVAPNQQKFQATHFTRERLLEFVEKISHEAGAEHRNRLGILLGNDATHDSTKTLTHVLWSLLNMLPKETAQRPHRHNSVALDLCVSAAAEGGVYTLMGPELGVDGWVKDPVRLDWKEGAVFVTPPGWWHSHHNESGEPAWVLPMQDAGLYTHQRTLDIRFAPSTNSQAPAAAAAAAADKEEAAAAADKEAAAEAAAGPAAGKEAYIVG